MNFKYIIVIFFFIFLRFDALSNEKISFVDIDYLLENSNLGKKITINLKKIHEENIQILKDKEQKLIKEENDIKKTKNIISNDEFNKNVNLLKKKINEFNNEKELIIQEFNKKKNKELKNFFDKINPILQEYMDKESITLLLEKKNIFIGKSTHDITLSVLEDINIKLK